MHQRWETKRKLEMCHVKRGNSLAQNLVVVTMIQMQNEGTK